MAAVHVVARIRGRGGWVTGAAAGGHSPEIDEHDKSSGGDTGLNDSTRQPTDLRIQCIEFLSSSPAEQGEGTPCKYLPLLSSSRLRLPPKLSPFSKIPRELPSSSNSRIIGKI